MAILMPRDLYILKALRHGPLSFVKLHAKLLTISKKQFGAEFVNKVDVDTLASPSTAATIKQEDYLFTKSALKSRLTRLLKDGYVKSKIYAHRGGKGRSALYVIGKFGIRELYPYGIERSDIRCNLPHKLAIPRESLVTDIVKVVKLESVRIGFKVKIVDEKYLRKTSTNKSTPMSDLMVFMTFHIDSGKVLEKVIGLEIDNDTIPVATIFKKCTKLERHTILLCAIPERIDKLKAYFATMSNDPLYEKIANKIFFALISDFMAEGFLGSEIVSVDGRMLQVLPFEFYIKTNVAPPVVQCRT